MSKTPPQYFITSDPSAITPVLPDIIAAADRERNSFGFMAAGAYATVALEGKLVVAKRCDDGTLAGYIMLGGTFPQARIFQTYVAPACRASGVGQALMEEVVRRCEERAYLSIRADVAEDLEAANRFYRNLGFRTSRRKKGGATTGRTIIVRVRELATPSLLDLAAYGSTRSSLPRIQISTSAEAPLYLIDLNVLFDVTKRRARRVDAGRVFAAAADNAVKVAVADEFITELERTTYADAPDPTLELAKSLPRLQTPPPSVRRDLAQQLGPLVFPARTEAETLTEQDRSDLLHLSTAIHEGADGFVTSEKAILAQADELRLRYGIDVLSPVAFGKDYAASGKTSEPHRLQLADKEIWCRTVSPDDIERAKLLGVAQEVPEHAVRSALASGTSAAPRRRIAVGSGERLIAYASWDAPRIAVVERRAYVFVDATHEAASLAVDYLLATAIRDTATDSPSVLVICPSPDDTLLRIQAAFSGFRPRSGSSSRAGKLEKICFAAVFTNSNWSRRRLALEKATGIVLPRVAPSYRNSSDDIRIVSSDRRELCIAVSELESLLSPALFATGERPAAIVPIKPDYAEELFSGSTQRSLLHQNRATLLTEKRYFSNRRTYRTIPEGGLIVFYESSSHHGRSAAIAIARVRRRYLANESTASQLTIESGVLGGRSLHKMAAGKQLCVTEFDNVAVFSCPVPLHELKQIGCADDANLVTARSISPPALEKLLSKAFGHG